LREGLLPPDPERFAVCKHGKDGNARNYNVACCFVWPGNFVARTYIVHLVVGVENRVTKIMSATKRKGVTSEWRKLRVGEAS
jgi:hypothetical protein